MAKTDLPWKVALIYFVYIMYSLDLLEKSNQWQVVWFRHSHGFDAVKLTQKTSLSEINPPKDDSSQIHTNLLPVLPWAQKRDINSMSEKMRISLKSQRTFACLIVCNHYFLWGGKIKRKCLSNGLRTSRCKGHTGTLENLCDSHLLIPKYPF